MKSAGKRRRWLRLEPPATLVTADVRDPVVGRGTFGAGVHLGSEGRAKGGLLKEWQQE
jgi:hypothetical protein